MSDLQTYFRHTAVTSALTAGCPPDHSEHLYLIDQSLDAALGSEKNEPILWVRPHRIG
jgi:hypothetical protein